MIERDKFAIRVKKFDSTGNGGRSARGLINFYRNRYLLISGTEIFSEIHKICLFLQILQFIKNAGYGILSNEQKRECTGEIIGLLN